MKIAIFGASGRTGRPLVEQALQLGHEVTVLVRNPATFTIQHNNLKVITGDAMNVSAIEQTVAGSEAVISTLGHVKESPATLLATATRNIIAAMHKNGTRRLVSLTGAGVPDPADEPKFIDNLIRLLFKLPIGNGREVLTDSIAHVNLIKASNLEWVIVRGPRLTEKLARGTYKVTYVDKDSGTQIARADLAEFMLKQTTDTQWLGKLPVVSY